MKFPEAVEYERDGAKAYASIATERMKLEHAGWKRVSAAAKASSAQKRTESKGEVKKND